MGYRGRKTRDWIWHGGLMPIEESDEGKPGVILDYDKEGDLISLEVLDASELVSETRKIEFHTTG